MTRFVAWGVMIAIGAAAFVLALGFGYGGGPRIGSAPVPLALSFLLVVVAFLGMFTSPNEAEIGRDLRPFAAVVSAVILFILTIDRLGIVSATLLTMGVSYLGQTERRYAGMAIYACLFATALWLLFVVGLGLPIAAFGGR